MLSRGKYRRYDPRGPDDAAGLARHAMLGSAAVDGERVCLTPGETPAARRLYLRGPMARAPWAADLVRTWAHIATVDAETWDLLELPAQELASPARVEDLVRRLERLVAAP
jgi:hypothetical protein